MKLETLLKKISPLPYEVARGSTNLIPCDDNVLGIVSQRPHKNSSGKECCVALFTGTIEETDFDKAHAAYLAHAANVLPELVEASKIMCQTFVDAEDYIRFKAAVARAEKVTAEP